MRKVNSTLCLLALLAATPGCRTRPMEDDTPPSAATASASAAKETPGEKLRHTETPEVQPQPALGPAVISRVVRELAPAVVHLKTVQGHGEQAPGASASEVGQVGARPDGALGSGVLIDREGYIVTSQQIAAAAAANPARVKLLGGGEFPVKLISQDTELGVALLKFEPPVVPTIVELGSSDELVVGEWVIALGNLSGDEVTASAGIISSVGARGDSSALPSYRARGLLHTDAAIHAGNAGGPLINTQGRMVGINLSGNSRDASAELGVALPVSRLRDALPMLKRGGGTAIARTWLGVRILPDEGGRGALVSEVIAGGPADKAGIRRGDIIVTFAGQAVDHRILPQLSAGTAPGRRVPITLLRNGAPVTTELASEAKP